MKKIKILVADDHGVVRSGLRALFETNPEFAIVGEAADGERAVHLAESQKPDIAILDIAMPKLNGIEATRLIKEKNPTMGILILTMHEDEVYISEIVTAGANGYVLKNADKKEIFNAVKAVAAGQQFFSPGVSKVMIQGFIKKAKGQTTRQSPTARSLSKRELEILHHIVRGLKGPEIAEKLFLSVSTVNTHRANLMRKLAVHDTASLVRIAIEQALVPQKE